MKPTLKSKRRRARKREQKQVSRQLRRRRSSSGSEVSGDEHGGSGARQKVADKDDGVDDVSSSEITTESESHDTDEHRSDGGEDYCFDEENGAIERRDDKGSDVGLASGLEKLKLEDGSTTNSSCFAETPVEIPTMNSDCLAEKLAAVTVDDDGLAVKNTRLEVTAGPVTVVDGSCWSIGGDTSDKSVDTNDGKAMDSSGVVLTSRVCDVDNNRPSENYLSGDVGGDLSNIVKENKAESPMGREELAATPAGGEEEDSPEGGEEEVSSPVTGKEKAPLIQEVCSNDGKLSNGDATIGESGREQTDGGKARDKDAPETMLSWEDRPVVTEPVEHQVTFSNSLMYDLDDED